jgi:hypothetical protein
MLSTLDDLAETELPRVRNTLFELVEGATTVEIGSRHLLPQRGALSALLTSRDVMSTIWIMRS